MSKIYIPDLEASNCVVIRSSDVIRVYDTSPTLKVTPHHFISLLGLNLIYKYTLSVEPVASVNLISMFISSCVGFIFKMLDEVF